MRVLAGTLVADGGSDKILMPILEWAVWRTGIAEQFQLRWADFALTRLPDRSLAGRMTRALELYPCDLLFVHRDAESRTRQDRELEISGAMAQCGALVSHIPVIPVRMSEAWLLISEPAIRKAAENPNGRIRLDLPKYGSIESEKDPKEKLHSLLREATELSGRRRAAFPVHQAVHTVASVIGDFSPLEQLPAFRELLSDLEALKPQFEVR